MHSRGGKEGRVQGAIRNGAEFKLVYGADTLNQDNDA